VFSPSQQGHRSSCEVKKRDFTVMDKSTFTSLFICASSVRDKKPSYSLWLIHYPKGPSKNTAGKPWDKMGKNGGCAAKNQLYDHKASRQMSFVIRLSKEKSEIPRGHV
jgi:hypothetical protein